MKKENINPTEYVYEVGQMVNIEIPGKLVEGLLEFFDNVQKSETHYGLSDNYAKRAKEVTDKEGKLQKVELDVVNYATPDAYFSQAPQQYRSMLGAYALDLLFQFKQIHLDNIEKGIAKKVGTVQTNSVKDGELKLA